MQPLRPLAITVFQSAEKAYRWRLVELTPDGQWAAIDEQRQPEKTYRAAMASGLVQLQQLIEDLAIGPREEDPEAPPAKRKGGKGGLFGFGFGVPRT